MAEKPLRDLLEELYTDRTLNTDPLANKSEMKAITPHPLGAALSGITGRAKEFFDKGEIAYRGPGTDVFNGVPGAKPPSMGFGELLFGQAPEALERWSLGFPPWTGKGQTLTLDPEAIDIAALPTFGAVGLAKQGPRVLRGALHAKSPFGKMGRTPPKETVVDESRRKFLKGAGAVGVLGAAAPAALLKSLEKKAPAAIAKVAVKRATAKEIVKNMSGDTMRRYARQLDQWRDVWKPDKYPRQYEQHAAAEKVFKDLPEDFDVTNVYTQNQLDHMEDFVKSLPDDVDAENALRLVTGDPTAKYPDYGKLGSEVEDLTRRHAPPDVAQKMEDATEAMYEVSGDDMDLWIATGKPPASYPDDLLPYLDYTHFSESSGRISAWHGETGMEYSPGDMLHDYVSSKAATINIADPLGPADSAGRLIPEVNPIKDPGKRDTMKSLLGVGAAVGAAALGGKTLAKTLSKKAPAAMAKAAAKHAHPPAPQVIGDGVRKIMEDIMQVTKKWTPAEEASGKVPYDMIGEYDKSVRKYYSLFNDDDTLDVTKLLKEDEIAGFDELLKELPEDIDPVSAYIKGYGYQTDIPDPDVGSKIANGFGPGGIEKHSVAVDELRKLSGKDIDLWLMTGRRPKGFSQEAADYIDIDDLYDNAAYYREMLGGNPGAEEAFGAELDPMNLFKWSVEDPGDEIYKKFPVERLKKLNIE